MRQQQIVKRTKRGTGERVPRPCTPRPDASYGSEGGACEAGERSHVRRGAWFECADPKSPALVVYDTGTGREVVHQPMPFCDNTVPTGPRWPGVT